MHGLMKCQAAQSCRRVVEYCPSRYVYFREVAGWANMGCTPTAEVSMGSYPADEAVGLTIDKVNKQRNVSSRWVPPEIGVIERTSSFCTDIVEQSLHLICNVIPVAFTPGRRSRGTISFKRKLQVATNAYVY